jgi:ATP-dependent exoDNAse (exonuclease V) beta subunit
MKWKNKFNYPKSTRSIEDGYRKYFLGEEKLPSVTTILSATKSEEEKAALANWRERVGFKEANRIKTEASSRGTSMHSYIEDYLRGRINESFFESNEQYKNMAKEIIEKGIDNKLDEIYGIEETLYYPEQYAGTADLIGVYQGNDVVIDFKQSNKPKKTDYIQDYFLQLGAYTLAHDVVHGTKMKAGIILLCTKDILFQEFKIEGAELEMYQNLFLGRVKKFYEMNNIA